MGERRRGVRLVVVVGTAALAASAAFAGIGIEAAVDRCDGGLDLSDWRSPPGQEQQKTAESIARCHRLDGKRRSEVAVLLGPATEREPGVWYYEVGDVGHGLTDGQALVVRFTPEGTVERTQMLR
jgi:hypothetical protein